MEQSTISMAMFHSDIDLPDGMVTGTIVIHGYSWLNYVELLYVTMETPP